MAKLRVYFATNRNHIPENKKAVFGGQFNPDGIAALRFGFVDCSFSGTDVTLDEPFVYPDKKEEAEKANTSKSRLGSDGFLKDLQVAMKDGCTDTLVFIHGYNVEFLEALKAGAHLSKEITIGSKPLNVVVFSWPSDGKMVPMMSYYSDREDARTCGAAVARTYLKLLDFVTGLDEGEYCGRSLHLLAHSMGNYVLRNGLQALHAKDPRRIVRLFDEIILAAPDEDDDAFECDDKLKYLPSLGRRVTLYHNRNDRALLVSDKTKSNPDRLGSDGPRMLDLLPKKVVVVDCSRAASAGEDRLSGHSYFINCPPVSSDLTLTLGGELADSIPNRDSIRAERAYRIKG